MSIVRAQKINRQVNSVLSQLSGIAVCLITLIILIDVTGRYLFNSPLWGNIEMVEALLVFMVFLGLTYTEILGRHLKVTILESRLPLKWQNIIQIFGLFLGLILMGLIAWQNLIYAMNSLRVDEIRLGFPMPVYPMKFAVFFGCSLLCIQFINEIYQRFAGKPETGKGEENWGY